MTTTEISRFYSRMNHELANRPVRRMLEAELRDLQRREFLSYRGSGDWENVVGEMKLVKERLRELDF